MWVKSLDGEYCFDASAVFLGGIERGVVAVELDRTEHQMCLVYGTAPDLPVFTGRPGILLFKGSRRQCLEYIDQQYLRSTAHEVCACPDAIDFNDPVLVEALHQFHEHSAKL